MTLGSFKLQTWLTVVALTLSNAALAQSANVEAKLKVNHNQVENKTSQTNRLEGYALNSYVINEQGQVTDIEPF
ncbi:hypothetical protein ACFOEE_02645 [Pseudoalteromonas fenneropenaei]|uniref:TonB-dependent receptor n=1 Tax=Pseudoalteromonas fenneropenaei TaxID=1737459 RepID=A0ABV7CFP1_9GAMM